MATVRLQTLAEKVKERVLLSCVQMNCSSLALPHHLTKQHRVWSPRALKVKGKGSSSVMARAGSGRDAFPPFRHTQDKEGFLLKTS